MEQIGYPELREHRKEHRYFQDTITDMSQRFLGSTDPKQATELMQFIYTWLTDHINVTDKKYSSHLRAKGIS